MLPLSLGLPQPPWIVAHRGASASEPENTLAAVKAGIEQGAHMIEVDVQLTSDGELVLVHDWEIELDGRTRVIEQSDSTALREAASNGKRTDASLLPTLDELLDILPDSMPLNVELKHRRGDPDMLCRRVLSAVGERPGVLLSSFDWDLLERIREVDQDASLAPIGRSGPHRLLRAAEFLGAATVHCHRRLAFSDFIAAAEASGWPVLVYTVNEVELAAELLDRGVDGLFTDRPGELLKALELD